MFIQTVIQATMRRMRRGLPPPPPPGERRTGPDRTGFILALVLFFVLLAAWLFSSLPER
jgi:hypothetical protein